MWIANSPENNPTNAQKQQPTEKQTNTKTEISLEVADRFFTFRLLGGGIGNCTPLPPISYITGYDILFLRTVSCPYSTATRYEILA